MWLTTYRRPASRATFPIYFVAIVALLVQALEQYYYGYADALVTMFPDVFASPVVFTEAIFLSVFAFGLVALIGVGMILGEPTHLLAFPLKVGGRYAYFPGMWTALLPMVAGLWGMYVLIRGYRHDKAADRASASPCRRR